MKKMNKTIKLLLMVLIVCGLYGCGQGNKINLKQNDELTEYRFTENDELGCMQIELDEKVYLPYAPASVDQCDKLIGYFSDDQGLKYYVLSYKGADQDKWIIDCDGENGDTLNGHNIGMIYREKSVYEIPDCIKENSEYEWNEGMHR